MSDPKTRRSVRRLASASIVVTLVALVATLLAPTAPASAKIVSNWGFAYNDNPNPVGEYVMPKKRQWGSWKDLYPTEWATVSKVPSTTGLYRVQFPHIASKGIPHVTAVNKEPVSCHVTAWTPGLDNAQFVYVRCFSPFGAPADSGFSVNYTDNKDSDGLYGWVHAGASGAVLNSYNSSGGVNAISASGTGSYKVLLPGLSSLTAMGNIQVTAVSPYRPVRCKPAAWYPSASGQMILVTCYDAFGNTVPSDFTLTFNHKANLLGDAFPPKLWGYIWDDLAPVVPPSATNVNSVGSVNSVATAGTGLRLVTFYKIGEDPSQVQVTAFGANSSFCNLNSAWKIADGHVFVRDVACYSNAGAPTDEQSFVSYTSNY